MNEPTEIDRFIDFVCAREGKKNISISYERAKRLLAELREVQLTARRVEYQELEHSNFEKFLREREQKEQIWWRDENAIARVSNLLAHYEHQRDSAYSLLGSFCEQVVISLRAIQMVVKQCHGHTHRQIDARLDVVEEAIQEAIGLMLKDRSDGWAYMETDLFSRKDWDFRRLAAENARLRADLERVKKDGEPVKEGE